jgi:superfamily II DNA or RNA helicase
VLAGNQKTFINQPLTLTGNGSIAGKPYPPGREWPYIYFMELRPYQIDAVNNLRKALMSKLRVVLQSATGSGKSVIFTDVAKKVVDKGRKVLILTHRQEIFDTTVKHFTRAGIKVEPINPGNKAINIYAQVFVAMVETFHRRNLLLQIDLIIIDEAHFGNFTKILDSYPSIRTIGVTATPIGPQFYKYYQDIVQTISIKELINQGYLVPCRAYQMQDDISDLKKAGSDYSDDSLYAHYNKKEKYIGVVDEYKNRAIGKPTLVFNVNIKHCQQMHDEFVQAGIVSAMVTSLTPDEERKQILRDFQDRKIAVINSVGILTTGVDMPCTEVIIVNRATTSLSIWLQMQGRASRPYPGKKEFIVLDFGRNHDEHGLWVEDREWSLKPPKKKKRGVPVIKSCKQCTAILNASVKICPYCDAKQPNVEYKLIKGKFVEMEVKEKKYDKAKAWTYNAEQLYEAYCEQTIKFHHAVRIAVKTNQIYTFAQIGGYTKGWAWTQSNIYKH